MSNEAPLEMTEQDVADLEALHNEPAAEKPPYRPVLKTWQVLLTEAVTTESTQRVTAGWATRITAMYKELLYKDMEKFRDEFFEKIRTLLRALVEEIESDNECLKVEDQAADVAENSVHYKNLIFRWQSAILGWEQGWHCTDEDSHIEIATISEVHRMFFGEQGITSHLDGIGFHFTEDDQKALAAHLESLKEASGE